MANYYLNSTEIKAYPVVNRSAEVSGDIYSRHTSEASLTGIVNKLIDTDGFVITPIKNFKKLLPFEFNIHGYYFKIEKLLNILDLLNLTTTPSSPVSVYASIALEKNGYWTEIVGCDKTDDNPPTERSKYYYTSVSFSIDPPSNKNIENYYIKLFTYVGEDSELSINGTGCVLNSFNYLKFLGSSFEVDGGDLDSDIQSIYAVNYKTEFNSGDVFSLGDKNAKVIVVKANGELEELTRSDYTTFPKLDSVLEYTATQNKVCNKLVSVYYKDKIFTYYIQINKKV